MKNTRISSFLVSVCILLTITISKIVQYNFMPAKYFIDSNKILNMMGGYLEFEAKDAFVITAYISRSINIFNLDTLLQWSVFYTVIFSVAIIILVRRFMVDTLAGFIWILASVGIVGLYSFNLGKDVFQLVMFLLIYAVLASKLSLTQKRILLILILFAWGNIFRSYFMLIGAYSVLAYLVVLYLKRLNKMSFSLLLFMLIFGVFVSLALISVILPDEYNTVIFVHHRLTARRIGTENAMTLITDVFAPSNAANIFVYMLNYIINMFRMMFPFELLVKLNLSYLLFFSYQASITALLIRRSRFIFQKDSSDEHMLAFCIYIGFVLGSALFEPDFGSWVRHESTTFPVLMCLFYKPKEDYAPERERRAVSRYIRDRHMVSQ